MFLDDVVAEYRDIYLIENQVRDMAQNILKLSLKRRKKKQISSSSDAHQRRFSGSFAEGGFSAAWFKPNSNLEDLMLDFDVDFETTVGKIDFPQKNHCIINNGQGFALVRYDSERCKLNSKHDNKIYLRDEVVSKEGFLMPHPLKSYLLGLKYKNNSRSKFFISTSFLRKWLNDISIERFDEKVTKATYQQIYLLKIPMQFQLLVTLDYGITIQLDWQTDYIKRWIQRKRQWPDISLMQRELNTTYLIAKCPTEEKSKPDSKLFRYSFAHIEQKIISMQNEPQRVIYYIAKSIFYKHVKSLDPEKVQSFLLKNTMLWICENIPPTNDTWNYLRVLEGVGLLLERLEADIEKGFMSYYFIPEINVIGFYPEHLLVEMAKVVRKIRLDIRLYAEETYSDLPKDVLSFIVERLTVLNRNADIVMAIRYYF